MNINNIFEQDVLCKQQKHSFAIRTLFASLNNVVRADRKKAIGANRQEFIVDFYVQPSLNTKAKSIEIGSKRRSCRIRTKRFVRRNEIFGRMPVIAHGDKPLFYAFEGYCFFNCQFDYSFKIHVSIIGSFFRNHSECNGQTPGV